LKTRIIAASLHFLVSILIVSLSLSVIYFIWYPNPFHSIHSVIDAVKIVVFVDLLLGPFLTFIVYNPLKSRKELISDLTIIIVIQIAALSWGLHITHKMRPLFFVFQGDTFYPILKEEINLKNLNSAVSAPAIWQSPKTIYIKRLKGDALNQRMGDILNGKKVKGEMYEANKYLPLSLDDNNEYRQDVEKNAMSYNVLLNSKTWAARVKKLILSKGGSIEDYLFYPVENDQIFRGLIAFNKKDFSFVGLVHDD